MDLKPCQKSVGHRCMGIHFQTLNSIPLRIEFMAILMPVPHCLDYCNFINFEIGKCESSDFVPFQDYFGYLGPLTILYKFEDQLLHFWGKKCCWNFERGYTEFVDHFG